ncbi:spore coat protein [Cellulosilyticum lentocellum]|uniref:Coat F domain protein n=1 Tax=Cellulosilyticum lentocellum (strain ATCC 49066 / DSM 5427 / NCIMB 11756 / RHM5) TaxID=642492 RepID=F2JIE6_CELLD|nr:spore coat protein [Cellulosilyticum lentocellum]ADZ84312.1 Coat F domain protein [Cellulosilyticum lentocellum DSM 5427]
MTNYGDKELLTDALDAQKTETNNYNTFANECAHPNLRNTFLSILSEEHDIQFQVFNTMHAAGFYPTPPAEQAKIDEAKQTHACCYKASK